MTFSLLNLYLLATKISLMSFGGIYSFWAILNLEAVVACQDNAALVNQAVTFCRSDYDLVLALSPVLPGPQVNVASILGYGVNGLAGMLAMLLGLLTPVFLISPLMYNVHRRYKGEVWVKHFFRGTSIAVIAILAVFFGAILSRAMPKEIEGLTFAILLFASVFYLSYKQRLNPILAVLAGAFVGLFLLQ